VQVGLNPKKSSQGQRQFTTLAVSNVQMKAKKNSYIRDNQAHYEEVYTKVKERHERKRLKLPNSFRKQQIKYEPAMNNFF
jgi:hypothetical protein